MLWKYVEENSKKHLKKKEKKKKTIAITVLTGLKTIFPQSAVRMQRPAVRMSVWPFRAGAARPLRRWARPSHQWSGAVVSVSREPRVSLGSTAPEEWRAGGASSSLSSTTRRRNMSSPKTGGSGSCSGSTSWPCWGT